MKNVTLSADDDLIEQARRVARSQHKTLNAAYREWLQQYAAQASGPKEFGAMMQRLGHVRAGRHLSGEQINER